MGSAKSAAGQRRPASQVSPGAARQDSWHAGGSRIDRALIPTAQKERPWQKKAFTRITAKFCSSTCRTVSSFVTRSCANTKEMGKTDDGRELPLFKLDTTSESHPFYTGTQKSVDNMGGRVEKFRNRFGKTTGAASK
jgi:large subunit ribosomal protein L31